MSNFIVIDTIGGFTCAVEIGPNHRDYVAKFGNTIPSQHALVAFICTYMVDDGYHVVLDLSHQNLTALYRIVTQRIADQHDNYEAHFALQRKLEALKPSLTEA